MLRGCAYRKSLHFSIPSLSVCLLLLFLSLALIVPLPSATFSTHIQTGAVVTSFQQTLHARQGLVLFVKKNKVDNSQNMLSVRYCNYNE